METLKKEDLKEGEIYSLPEYGNGDDTLCRFSSHSLSYGIHGRGIYNTTFYKGNEHFTCIKDIKVASDENKHWLNECIRLDKFISKEEAMKSFKKQPEFVIGKWYKLPKNSNYIAKYNGSKTKCLEYFNKEFKYITTSFGSCDFEDGIEVSLEEIQQYLPDGHVDKIVKSKNMFVKDDYIVLLKGPEDSYYKVNFCYKQRNNASYLSTYLDSRNSHTNGWTVYDFDKTGKLGGIKTDWRYATKEEIVEYDRLGKPYDVTTLNKSTELTSLPEKWLIYFDGIAEHDKELIKYCELSDSFKPIKDKYYINYDRTWGDCNPKNTKITFEQFKKWVLKEGILSTKIEAGDTVFNCKIEKNCVVVSDFDYNNIDIRYLPYVTEGAVESYGHTFVKKGNDYGYNPKFKQEEKSLVGRYVKWLVDYSSYHQHKIGDYSLITEENPVRLDGNAFSFNPVKDNKDKWELMPEGFEPNKVKTMKTEEQWIPKVGDWITIENSSNLESGCTGCLSGTWQVVNEDSNNGLISQKPNDFVILTEKNRYWKISTKGVRKAEPHEIPNESNFNIPEYVECIKSHDNNKDVGTIYHYKSLPYWFNSYSSIESWLQTSNIKNDQYFKPSTKKAFDKQNSKSIEMTKEELLEKAKRRYPIGTVCRPAHLTSNRESFEVKGNYRYDHEGFIIVDVELKEWYTPVLFDKTSNKWAEIINRPYRDTSVISESSVDYIGKTVIEPDNEVIIIKQNKRKPKLVTI